MPQPPAFTPSRDYSEDETNEVGGRDDILTASLDTEFVNLKAFVDQLRTNISLIQRDDGEIRDGMVKTHTLAGDIAAYLAAQIGVLNASTNLITGVDSGVADAYVVTTSEAIETYPTLLTVWFQSGTTNTGASTLQVDDGPAESIVKDVSTALDAGDMTVNKMMLAVFDGTNWQLINPFLDIGIHTADVANPHAVTATQVGLSALTNALQLVAANDLSDLASAATARTNLGVQVAVDLITASWVNLSKAAAYTVLVTDTRNSIIADGTAGAFTLTLDLAATLGDGFMITIKKEDSSANAITIATTSSETIDKSTTKILGAQNDSVVIVCDGTEFFIVAEVNSGTSTDEQLRISSLDTTSGFYEDKILAGTNIVLTKANPAGNETMTISSPINSGAITQTEIGASAVGQGEIKGTVQDTTHVATAGLTYPTFSPATSSTKFTSTGSVWELGFQLKISTTTTNLTASLNDYAGSLTTSFVAQRSLGCINPTTGTPTITVRLKYVQASPPYDMGDGIVYGFIYALINVHTSDIISMHQAPDPPWANNGPTDIRGSVLDKSGKKMRWQQDMRSLKSLSQAEKRSWMAGDLSLKQGKKRLIEITPEFKNSDMAIIPHPYQSMVNADRAVVMLDPMDPLVGRMMGMQESGDYPLEEIFHGGYATIDNVEITKRKGSPGVPIHKAKMK